MLSEEVKRYRELSGDNNPNTPISRIGGYLDGYEKAMEQRIGHWIELTKRIYACSECSLKSNISTEYCPSCGAKMKEGD